jgi:1-deoxy-D-xylulose-5-phosphate reductoisomerase
MDYPSLTFEQADRNVFKNLDLAYRVMDMQGTAACALNAANEVAVAAFLENKISFLAISELNEHVVMEMTNTLTPKYDDFVSVDLSAREITLQKIERL